MTVTVNLRFYFPKWVRPALVALGWLVKLGIVSEARAVTWAKEIGRRAILQKMSKA